MLGGHKMEDCKILPDGTVLDPDGTKIGFVEIEGAPAAPKPKGAKVKRPRKKSAEVKEGQTWLDPIPPLSSADLDAGTSIPRFAQHQAEAAAVAAEAAAAAENPPPPPVVLTDEELAEKELAEARDKKKEGVEEEEVVAPPPKKGLGGLLSKTPSLGLPLPGLGLPDEGVLIVLGSTGVGKTRLLRTLEGGGTIHTQPEEMNWGEYKQTLLPTLGKLNLESSKDQCDMMTWDVPGDVASRPLVTLNLRGIKSRLKMMPHVLLLCDAALGGPTPALDPIPLSPMPPPTDPKPSAPLNSGQV